MSSIDSRVVTMKFDNAAFQRGAADTMSTLDKLKTALTGLPGATKGMDALSNVTSKFSLGNLADQITGVKAGFVAMATVGITALANITNRAVDAGLALVKSFTIAPITQGFGDYETKINAVQTILSNTAAQGTKLPEVTKALANLNTYANKTVYNFAEMAKNIGTFTAAGVDLKTSVASIKGIANLAALSGSNSQQASTAMYQLSQAIAAGQVHLQDWNSVVNAGIGGAVFQKALVTTGQAMGTIAKGAVTTEGPMHTLMVNGMAFRNSLTPPPGGKSWLTSDVLTKTLSQFTGDMSKATLVAQGFTKAQADSIIAQGKAASRAATQVKTFSQLMQALKEEVATAWSNVFATLFGNITQAKALFSPLHKTIENALTSPINDFNHMLIQWSKLGGRTTLIETIVQLFKDMGRVIKPIKNAFAEVFPPANAVTLIILTNKFRNFVDDLKLSKKHMHDVKAIFEAVFGVLKVGINIIGNIIHYFTSLFGLVNRGGGGFLDLAASVARVVSGFTDWLSQSHLIDNFFNHIIAGRAALFGPIIDKIGELLSMFARFINHEGKDFGNWIQSLQPQLHKFTSGLSDLKTKGLDLVQQGLDKLQPAIVWVENLASAIKTLVGAGTATALAKLGDSFSHLGDLLPNIGSAIGSSIGSALGGLSGKFHFNLGGLFDMGNVPQKASAGIKSVGSELSKTADAADRVKAAWESVKSAFAGVAHIFAPVGHAIGGAFGALKEKISKFVGSLGIEDALALVNTAFFIAFYRMATKFTGSLKELAESGSRVLDTLSGSLKTMQADVKSNIILKIAIALGILAVAITMLAKVEPKKLATAIGALSTMLIELMTAMAVLLKIADKSETGAVKMLVLATGIEMLALSMVAMAVAVKILSSIKTGDLVKGVMSLAAIMALAVGMSLLLEGGAGAQMLFAAFAIGVMAGALVVMAGALKLYSKIDTKTIISGGLKVMAVIAGLGLAMHLVGPDSLAGAAALLVISGALVVLAGVLKIMGGMSWSSIGKSMVVLGGSLLILGLAMAGMVEGLPGAAALLVMVPALMGLAVVMATLGHMDWSTVWKGLGILAVTLGGLALLSLVLAPFIPFIAALSIVLVVLGAAALLAGTGLVLFSTGLATLAASGAAGFAVLIGGATALAEAFPLLMHQFGLGLRALAVVIKNSGPQLIGAFGAILHALAVSAIKNGPILGRALLVLIHTGLKVLRGAFPDVVNTGYDLILTLLKAIDKHIVKITTIALDIIYKFIMTLAKNQAKLATAGLNLIINFINALARAIDNHHQQINDAAGRLGWAIINGLISAISDGAKWVWQAAINMAQHAIDAAVHVFDSHSPSKVFYGLGGDAVDGLANGLDNHARSTKAAAGMADDALEVFRTKMSKMGDVLSDTTANPTITPILDLTRLQQDATKIGSVLGGQSVTADVSYKQAASISAATQSAQTQETGTATAAGDVVFNQYNSSPKALSAIDIYRSTRSQISLAKEALKT